MPPVALDRLRSRTTGASLALALAVALACPRARAADASPALDRPFFVRIVGASGVGAGLRFNNPYRLATPLGGRAESLSRTAAYFDVGLGAFFGDPRGVQHGPSLRLDRSISGVGQLVTTPGYGLSWRTTRWEALFRIGIPIVTSPDGNVGGEGAGGAAYFFLAGLGVKAELIGGLFAGAATPTTKRPIYPVVSTELALVIEWERLP